MNSEENATKVYDNPDEVSSVTNWKVHVKYCLIFPFVLAGAGPFYVIAL